MYVHVEITLMPASRSSSTDCQRFSWGHPGHSCARARRRAPLGRRASTASVSVPQGPCRGTRSVWWESAQDPRAARCLRAVVRFHEAYDDSLTARGTAARLGKHRERLADSRRVPEEDLVQTTGSATGAARNGGRFGHDRRDVSASRHGRAPCSVGARSRVTHR